jgi:hypothetical protein
MLNDYSDKKNNEKKKLTCMNNVSELRPMLGN